MALQRDDKGRWLKGHKGAFAWGGEVNRLRKLLYCKLTNKNAADIWQKLIDMAIDGDKGAAEMLMNYAGMKWKEDKEQEQEVNGNIFEQNE